MRPVPALAAIVALMTCLAVARPTAAAVSVKAEAPPAQLGGCAIALSRWNGLVQARGDKPQVEYLQRLDAIRALSHTRPDADPWNRTLTDAMLARIAVYDAMSGADQVKAIQRDLFGCEGWFNADTRPPDLTYAGPFLAGPGWKITLATPPSYAGYCYLAFASLMNFQAAKGINDPQVMGARNGFNEIIGGMGDGYRNVAVESANSRNTFYTNTRSASGDAEFLRILEGDVKDCAKWIVER